MLARCSLSSPASMRAISTDPLLAVDLRHRRDGDVAATRPSTPATCVSAGAATWARWVTTSTWCRPPSSARRGTDRDRRAAADAGVDLVEHQRRRSDPATGAHERQPQGQHRPRQLAARRNPAERQQRRARVGGEQEPHVVAGVSSACSPTSTPTAACGIASSRKRCLDRGRQQRRRARAGAADDHRLATAARPARAVALARRARPPAARSARARPAGARPRRGTRSPRPASSPYLRRRSCSSWRRSRIAPAAPGPPRCARRGRAGRRRRRRARRTRPRRRSRDRVRTAGAAARAGARLAERLGRRRRRRGAALDRGLRRLAVGDRVGQQRLLGSPAARPRRRRRWRAASSSSTWKRSRSTLAGAGPLVAAERRQLGVDLGQPGAGGAQRCQVDRRRSGRARRAGSRRRAGSGGRAGRAGRPRAVGELGQRRPRWPGAR